MGQAERRPWSRESGKTPGCSRPSPPQPRASCAGGSGSGHHQVCLGCRARRKGCGFPKDFTRCSVFEEAGATPHAWLGLTHPPDLSADEAIKSVSKFRGPPGLSEPGALAVCAGGSLCQSTACLRAPPRSLPCGPGPGAQSSGRGGSGVTGAECSSRTGSPRPPQFPGCGVRGDAQTQAPPLPIAENLLLGPSAFPPRAQGRPGPQPPWQPLPICGLGWRTGFGVRKTCVQVTALTHSGYVTYVLTVLGLSHSVSLCKLRLPQPSLQGFCEDSMR